MSLKCVAFVPKAENHKSKYLLNDMALSYKRNADRYIVTYALASDTVGLNTQVI